MPVSPQEFSLWARMTGNKYPNSVEEKARLAPEVHNFSQNVGKQGALGVKEPTTRDPGDVNMREYTKSLGDEYNSLHEQIVSAPGRVDPAVASRYNELNQHIQNSASVFPWNKPSPLDSATVQRVGGTFSNKQEEEPERQSNLGSKLAKGALIAGGIAAGVAAARNPGVQEAVKTASGKASDFLSKITTPREVNVDTAEAVRDVTNSAPGDVYSQAIIPVSQRVGGYEPEGLLSGRGIGGAGDRAQRLISEIVSKSDPNLPDEEYVHPSRIPGMPGGDYRGRRTTYTPEQKEAFRLTKQEADERTILQNEGEIPPGMLTREQQAYLKLNELGGERLQAAKQRAKASPLVIGTPKGGYDSRHVYAQDSDDLIDPYGVSDERSEVNRARDYEQDQQMQADAYWNSPEGQAEILETQADAAYMNSDLGKANYEREAELDSRGLSYDHRPQIEAWKDNWKKEQAGNQSLSNKADAVISALGASDPDFGHTQYAPSEAVEAADADLSQNPVNTALSGPTTPGNNVPTIKGTYDPGTLTGQQQIQMAANNAVDELETDIIAIKRAEVEAKKAQIAESTGLSNPAVDRFLGKYFPSMTETYSDVDIASGRTPERTVPNVGPEAGVTKAASGTSIRGRSRVQDYEPSRDRQRDIIPEEEPLRGSPEPEQRPDIIGGRLPLGGVPGDLDTSEMSKQEVIQSIINPSTVDPRNKTPIAGTGVYGTERGYVSGAMKASGEYSDAAMRKPTDLSPAEAKYEKFSKDPYAGLSDEALQTHIQNARPGSPSQQGLQREAYRRSGAGIPISQKMREIHTTGDPLTRSERVEDFLDELRRNQQG